MNALTTISVVVLTLLPFVWPRFFALFGLA